MTTQPMPHESTMIEEVRRWRSEAFEADRLRTPEKRERDRAELLSRFGLKVQSETPPANRQAERKPQG